MSNNGLIAVMERQSDFPCRMYRSSCVNSKSNPGSASFRFCDAGTSCRGLRWAAQVVDCFAW